MGWYGESATTLSLPVHRDNSRIMAKEKEKSDREIRWEQLLERYEKSNPEKFKIKKEAGEFNEIPASFI